MENYIENRWEICRNCSICDLDNMLCNAYLYVNPKTNDVSTKPKEGFIKGCGCFLQHKIKNIKSKCPAGKW